MFLLQQINSNQRRLTDILSSKFCLYILIYSINLKNKAKTIIIKIVIRLSYHQKNQHQIVTIITNNTILIVISKINFKSLKSKFPLNTLNKNDV